jgi:hypothetical protein
MFNQDSESLIPIRQKILAIFGQSTHSLKTSYQSAAREVARSPYLRILYAGRRGRFRPGAVI